MQAVAVKRKDDGGFEMGGTAQGYSFEALGAGGLQVVEAEALDGWGAYTMAVCLEDADGAQGWYMLMEDDRA